MAAAVAPAAVGATSSIWSNPSFWGAVIGAGSSLLGGSKQAGNTTTTQDLPDWIKPYIQGNLGMGYDALKGYKPTGVAQAGAPEMMRTISGQYTDPRTNPYLQETFQQGANAIRGQLSPTFGHMQAFGGNTGWQGAFGRSLGNFANQLYGGNYQQERERQFNATVGAPGFETNYANSVFAPFNSYANISKGYFGGTTSQPYFENKSAGLLGGALAGAQLGGLFGGGKK